MSIIKHKHLSVRLEDDKDIPSIDIEPKEPVDYVQIVRDTALPLAKTIIAGIITYVAADTLRQVIVKSTPNR